MKPYNIDQIGSPNQFNQSRHISLGLIHFNTVIDMAHKGKVYKGIHE